MAGSTKFNRMRSPLMLAFRTAFGTHDSQKRVDERDDGGERVIAGRRATGRGAISESELQHSVTGDLETLMNTVNLQSTLDLAEFPEAGRSILNYGLPDVVHRTVDENGVNEVASEIETALAAYEPRLVRGSIRVQRDKSVGNGELRVRFVVRADLDCDPLNVPVEFVADVERTTGKISIATQ